MKSILIVDMQKGFINESNQHLVEKINTYLKENNFNNVIFTKCVNNSESPFSKILKWNDMITKESQDIIVYQPQNSKIFIKNGYGLPCQLINELKKLNINQIELCGTDTDACILANAFDLFDNNITPIILSDLCASSSNNKQMHDYAIKIIERQFGKDNVK